eukprot:988082-Pleurochrysis_carterae.AAC.2
MTVNKGNRIFLRQGEKANMCTGRYAENCKPQHHPQLQSKESTASAEHAKPSGDAFFRRAT